MKIVVVGTGYVGLVSAVCLAELGHNVWCIDVDASKISRLSQGIAPIYEPGIDALLSRQMANGRINFSLFDPSIISDCDILMIAVWTPTSDDSKQADLSAVYNVITGYTPHLKDDTVVIVKSTVPIGTNKKLNNLITSLQLSARIHLASNPEFLREGSAIEDFMCPNRIVVGGSSDIVFEKLRQIYQPLINAGYTYYETDVISAEMIKYAANAFLATKITFINEMANLCEKVGGNISSIAHGIGLDQRIGPMFLQVGPGYGGSCFPKDTRALAATAQEYNVNLSLVNQTIISNNQRFDLMAEKIMTMLDKISNAKKVGFLGLSFKANTDDIRDSPAIEIIQRLNLPHISVHVYDPQAHSSITTFLPHCKRHATAQDVLKDADLIVITTEWSEFKNIAPQDFIKLMTTPFVVDLRNIYDAKIMHKANIQYHALGQLTC